MVTIFDMQQNFCQLSLLVVSSLLHWSRFIDRMDSDWSQSHWIYFYYNSTTTLITTALQKTALLKIHFSRNYSKASIFLCLNYNSEKLGCQNHGRFVVLMFIDLKMKNDLV